jgi:short-subunit dehydrogenase
LEKVQPSHWARHGGALITGASAGLGAAFAQRLGREGYDLVLVARRRDRLLALAQQIAGETGVAVEVLVADLAQPQDLQVVAERVAEDAALEMLVNNAGFSVNRRFQQTDLTLLEAMIRVHIVAVTRLSRTALPRLLARDRGSIVNVVSTAAFLADPGSIWNTYAATKAFVITFTVGLHEDLRSTGVCVQALCPGWTRTEILERAGRPWDVPEDYTMQPDQVVEASLVGLRLGELVCCPSLHDAALLTQLDQLKDTIFGYTNTTGRLAPRYGRAAGQTDPSREASGADRLG